MNRKASSRRRSFGVALDALEPRALLSVLLASRPTAEVQIDRPRVRPNHGKGVSIIQPTNITITGTAQPPASNISTQVEVYALDAQGQVLNGGNPLATATPNFLGLYKVTFQLPSTIRKDMNTIVVRQRADGFLNGTQHVNATTLTELLGQLAIQATTISNLEASLGLQPGTLTNLQGDISIDGWDADFDGRILGIPDIITGTTENPDLTGSLSGGTGDISGSNGNLTGGTGNIAGTGGTFTQDGSAKIAATDGTIRIDVTEYAVSDPIAVSIHQSRGQAAPLRARRQAGNGASERPTSYRRLRAHVSARAGFRAAAERMKMSPAAHAKHLAHA